MAVIPTNVKRWDHIPIHFIPHPDPAIEKAVNALNEQLGFRLFAPLEGSDRSKADVEFITGGSHGCSPIGQQPQQPQPVNLRTPLQCRLMVHEMLHCAGFEHEQFHEKYPWDRTDLPDIRSADNRKFRDFGRLKGTQIKKGSAEEPGRLRPAEEAAHNDVAGVLTSAPVFGRPRAGSGSSQGFALGRPRAGSGGPADFRLATPRAESAEKEAGEEKEVSGEKDLSASSGVLSELRSPVNKIIYKYLLDKRLSPDTYLRELRDKQHLVRSISPDCDFNSIMMYQDFLEAAKAARASGQRGFVFNYDPSSDCDKLSRTDVECVGKLYPRGAEA